MEDEANRLDTLFNRRQYQWIFSVSISYEVNDLLLNIDHHPAYGEIQERSLRNEIDDLLCGLSVEGYRVDQRPSNIFVSRLIKI